jgi:hypothetical protein
MLGFIRNCDGSAVADEITTRDGIDIQTDDTVDGGSTVQLGFQYDPYGIHSDVDGGHASDNIGREGYNWQLGFQGGLIDPVAETVHFEARDDNPAIGSWTEPNPTDAAQVADGIDIGSDNEGPTD